MGLPIREGRTVMDGQGGYAIARRNTIGSGSVPVAIRASGVLIVLKETKDANILPVSIASKNSAQIIGKSPTELFDLNSFTEVFPQDQVDEFISQIDLIRDYDVDVATNGPEVFPISLELDRGLVKKLWCAVHKDHVHPGLFVCAFEPDGKHIHPFPPRESDTHAPKDTIDSSLARKEGPGGLEKRNGYPKVLRNTRTRTRKINAMDTLHVVSQVEEQFAGASDLQSLLDALVHVTKELTGFDHVLIYKFGQELKGGVVAELIDYETTKDDRQSLEFGVFKLSEQAEELYTPGKSCLLYERDQDTAQLVGRTNEELESPLDLTYSYLCAIPSAHPGHLPNVVVRSSMSISISVFEKPWGLVVCHSYGSSGTQTSFLSRKFCRSVSDSASRSIEKLSHVARLRAWKLINTVPLENDLRERIVTAANDLVEYFDADFGLISIEDEVDSLGHIGQSQGALAILEHLKTRKIESVTASTNIPEDFPDLQCSSGLQDIGGMLVIPMYVGSGDYIIFFRKGQMKQSRSETTTNGCKKWSEEGVEAATVLCVVYGKFAQIWKQKEAALYSSKLTQRLLLRTALDIQASLDATSNFLAIALGSTIDRKTRESLMEAHSTSNSLLNQTISLLNLI